ncbi:kinase-like domain-containing protein [Phyllosticta capitalensis]
MSICPVAMLLTGGFRPGRLVLQRASQPLPHSPRRLPQRWPLQDPAQARCRMPLDSGGSQGPEVSLSAHQTVICESINERVSVYKICSEQRNVALKITRVIIPGQERRRESNVLHSMSAPHPLKEAPGARHLMRMLDHFTLDGVAGIHDCFVLELVGQKVDLYVEEQTSGRCRLPARVAKRVAKEALMGLDNLHKRGIVHGEIRTGNLVFSLPHSVHSTSEAAFCAALGSPQICPVVSGDGEPVGPEKPAYIVAPASFPEELALCSQPVKLIDFGESFLSADTPRRLSVDGPSVAATIAQAPGVVFGEPLDHRIDLWSMGVMLFELITGVHLFAYERKSPTTQINEMLHLAPDALPARWQSQWRAMCAEQAFPWHSHSSAAALSTATRATPHEEDTQQGHESLTDDGDKSLRDHLAKEYFGRTRRFDLADGEENDFFTESDIAKMGEMIGKLIRLEPAARVSVADVLADSWWDDV